MFIVPRTWSQGESAIRHESVNQGLANNLEAFRQLATKRIGIATRSNEVIQLQRGSNTSTVTSTTYLNGGSATESVPAAFLGNGMSTTSAFAVNQPCVLWVPFKAINAFKKSSESIYIQVRLSAEYRTPDEWNETYPVTGSVIEYEYLGSSADPTPASNVFSSIGWSPTLSSPTLGSSGRIYLATQETQIDTSAMSTTDVSLAAFRFRFKQYVMLLSPPVFGSGAATRQLFLPGPEPDTLRDFKIRVDLVIK